MNRFKIISAAVIILLTANSLWGNAKLTIPENKFEFGIVPQHATVNHTFWLHSTGIDTLIIDEVKPGCNCTKAPLEKKILAPGDSTRLEIIFSSKTFRRRTAKRPLIISNSEGSGKNVVIIADVTMYPDSTYPVVFKPFILRFDQTIEPDRKYIEFNIENISDEDLSLELIEYPDEVFKLKLPKKIKAGQESRGKLEIKKDYRGKQFKKSFTVEFIGKEKNRYTIPVEGN